MAANGFRGIGKRCRGNHPSTKLRAGVGIAPTNHDFYPVVGGPMPVLSFVEGSKGLFPSLCRFIMLTSYIFPRNNYLPSLKQDELTLTDKTMLEILKNQFTTWGLPSTLSIIVSVLILLLAVFLLSFIVDKIAKHLLLKVLKVITAKTKTKWDDALLEQGVFRRLAHLAPALVIYSSAPLFKIAQFQVTQSIEEFIRRVAMVYMALITILVLDSFLNAVVQIYRHFEVSKQRPIKSYVQVIKIIVYFLAAIFILSILMNKSPWAFLTGLGALTAVLVLVFKDSILGFVASIQVASNDMVRIGDWIEMPKYGADGDVIDMSLNTIKVQNWDKTITTIPTYGLVTEPIKNWRGMSESGGRRIKRTIYIDMNSIKFCDQEQLERLEKIQYLTDYLKKKKQEVKTYNQEKQIDTSNLVNGRHLTNVGTFRAYIISYLKHHPEINQKMTFLVRHRQPTEKGLPIEIYVFSSDKVWANYEAIQADIFDHFLAVIGEFNLRVFQNPSGQDIQGFLKENPTFQ